ncbi:hypothetical protein [Pseudonocardia sp. GCM10023141]|uniref:hypothetical protein n=1 Tax=Pseudonocardia sp. GCM10023141 TaxID=3252653 RepID=UPI00360AA5C0
MNDRIDRCKAAVAKSGRAADYPAPDTWRDTYAMGTGALETALVFNDALACLTPPGNVIVSGRSGTPAGAVSITRMSRGKLVVFNPERVEYLIGLPARPGIHDEAVAFVDIYAGETPAQMRLVAPGHDGPAPEPAAAPIVFDDRGLPDRPDSPDGAVLDDCIGRSPTHRSVRRGWCRPSPSASVAPRSCSPWGRRSAAPSSSPVPSRGCRQPRCRARSWTGWRCAWSPARRGRAGSGSSSTTGSTAGRGTPVPLD